jgi:predicted amino acid-binding ACT domain protein
LTIEVSTDEEKTTVSGTILTHGQPLITAINGHPINLYPVPMMLFTMHHDQPGVVAKVAGILSKHDINISNMSLARVSVRENAFMVMGVDDPLSQTILDELIKLSGIYKAHFVSLQLLGHVSK